MNGFINLLKPSGITASDAVVAVRKILGEKKVGHLGTLDPLATGVLPIAVGKGTKLFNLLLNKKKTYRAFFTFGKTTDTLDSDGIVTEACKKVPAAEELAGQCTKMTGKQMQMPPAYSAKSINGTRAYVLARKGEEVSLNAKPVEIFSFDLVRQSSSDTFVFDVCCSSGTYIRSIVRDMAQALGTCGYMSALIRTESGIFNVENAVTLDKLQAEKEGALLSIEAALTDVPRFDFDEKCYKQLSNGVKLPFKAEEYHKIYCRGELFGVGKGVGGFLDLEFYLK